MSRVATPVAGLLAVRATSYDEHVALVGALPDLTPAQLLAEVRDAGLTGRGGAAFPAARKHAAVAARPGGGRRPSPPQAPPREPRGGRWWPCPRARGASRPAARISR